MRTAFYDGTYSDDTIHRVKHDFELLYQSYITPEQATELKRFVDDLAAEGVERIYVHCYFGRSRSTAVADYLGDTHGYAVTPAVEKSNATVRTLLDAPDQYAPLIRHYRKPAEDETPPAAGGAGGGSSSNEYQPLHHGTDGTAWHRDALASWPAGETLPAHLATRHPWRSPCTSKHQRVPLVRRRQKAGGRRLDPDGGNGRRKWRYC